MANIVLAAGVLATVGELAKVVCLSLSCDVWFILAPLLLHKFKLVQSCRVTMGPTRTSDLWWFVFCVIGWFCNEAISSWANASGCGCSFGWRFCEQKGSCSSNPWTSYSKHRVHAFFCLLTFVCILSCMSQIHNMTSILYHKIFAVKIFCLSVKVCSCFVLIGVSIFSVVSYSKLEVWNSNRDLSFREKENVSIHSILLAI